MADDTKCGPGDSSRINLSKDYEGRHWTGKFGVSKKEIERAIERTGGLVKDVQAELENKKRKVGWKRNGFSNWSAANGDDNWKVPHSKQIGCISRDSI